MPSELVVALTDQHARGHVRWRAGDSEGCLESIGKYTEAGIRCCQHLVTGQFTALSRPLPPFDQLVRALESTPPNSCPDSLRLIAPRVLYALYSIRNKRGGGHVSDQANAERVDALVSLQMADWFLAELVRVLSTMPLDDSQALVDSLVERDIPVLYRDEHVRIVLNPDLPLEDEIIVLLYPEPTGLTEPELITSTARSRSGVRGAIERLCARRYAYKTTETPYRVRLLPPALKYVENAGILTQHGNL